MELHHKLKRDPSWHPNSCNLCGQLGHQAANCMVGTVNWRSMYPAEAFLLRRPVFQSELDAIKKARTIDFDALEKQAKEYATLKKQGKIPTGAAKPPPPVVEDLPPGWGAARDPQGKIYYWHKETKKVQWNKPTLPKVEDTSGGGDNGGGATTNTTDDVAMKVD